MKTKLKIKFIFAVLLLGAKSLSAQFSESQIVYINEQCTNVLREYEMWSSTISDPGTERYDRPDAEEAFLMQFSSPNAMCYNDLDPTLKTGTQLPARSYLRYLFDWYPSGGLRAELEYSNMDFGKITPIGNGNYACLIVLKKKLLGTYMGTRLVNTTIMLEFTMAFDAELQEFKIAEITRPQSNKAQISIKTSPTQVKVYLNGNYQGQTTTRAFLLKELTSGSYQVELRKNGYQPHIQKITLRAGQKYTLIERLKKINEGMVLVKGGTFQMGGDGYTEHRVTVSDFYMGKYEVTHAEYIKFLNQQGVNSSGSYSGTEYIDMDDSDCAIGYRNGSFYFKGSSYAGTANCPVIEVTWFGAKAYCEWAGGRLPTEAEWEYACRAGTSSPFNTGSCLSTSQANYDGNYPYSNCSKGTYREKTVAVGSFSPNAWGLYDMHGNVWEWCSDWYGSYSSSSQTNPTGASSGSRRVLRGGSWDYDALLCRSANRIDYAPANSDDGSGFRLVRAFSSP